MGNTCRGSFGVKNYQGFTQPEDHSNSKRTNPSSAHSNSSDYSPTSLTSQHLVAQEFAKDNQPSPKKKDHNLPLISPTKESIMSRGSNTQTYYVLGHKTANIRDLYTLGRKLGQGQFGTTYLCTENSTGIEYACKSISKRKLISKEDVEDVRREIQIMHHLAGHKNIVTIKGAYEDPLYVHIVMELCSGGELFDRIIQRGHYSERKAAELTKIIVGVVESCHSLGVMHRDLKPENFLLVNKDDDFSLKAIDFGLSVFFKPGQVFTDVVGSPYYVAPEVLLKHYGPEADVWTAGVILYILLSGVPPFWAETQQGIFDAVLKGHIDFESDPWPLISDSAKDLIRKMLCSRPSDRLTAHEVLSMDPDASTSSSASRTSGVSRRRAALAPVPPRTRQARRLAEAIIHPDHPDVEEVVPPEVAVEEPSSSTPAPPSHRALSGASVQIPDLLGRDLSRHPSASLVANEVPEFTQPRGNWFNIYSLYAALHSDYREMVDSWGFRHFFTIIPRQCPWGYMRALSERWFHQTQSLHLLDCEVVLTPWDWRYITGIEFTGSRVPLDLDITPAEVRALLGFAADDRVFKARSIRSGALAVDAVGGLYAQPIPADQGTRVILLRRLFLTIMRGCFLGNNSSTIHFSVVGAVRDVDRIGAYDWGSFTFAYFLHGLRLRSEGQTDAWLGFYHFLLFWAYERLPCLRPVTTLGPDTYPRGRRWHHNTLEEVPVSGSFAHCRIQLELITAAEVVWTPYLSEHLVVGFTDGHPSGPEFALSTRRLTLQSVGGWVMYLGERAFRCVTGETRIPHSLPFTTSWPLDSQPSEIMLAGEDGRMLSTGPSTSDAFRTWWVPRTIGPQTRATFFLGDMVPGSVMMTDWAACVRTPTHAEQIATLTRQVDQLSLYLRVLGRTPADAYAYDPDSAGYDAGPSSSDATTHPYIPDMNFGPPTSTTPGDQFEDPAFIDDI